MTIKLITYQKAFYPYVWGYKIRVYVGLFRVMRDEKLMKQSFSEINVYTDDILAEIDTLAAGLSWIIQNVPDTEREKLEVIFCGGSRMRMKKDIENGILLQGYKLQSILKMILKFDDVFYVAPGKIIGDEATFQLYETANKVFELYYGRNNGYMHTVYEEVGENRKMMIVGEPEIRWKKGAPIEEWS